MAICYRALSDQELAQVAEDRLALVQEYYAPGQSSMWDEVLYRLKRARCSGWQEDRGHGERTGVLIC